MNSVAALLYNELYKNFNSILNREFERVFGCRINTFYNYISDQPISQRIDNEELTNEQMCWIKSFTIGYDAAMSQLLEGENGSNLYQ